MLKEAEYNLLVGMMKVALLKKHQIVVKKRKYEVEESGMLHAM